MPDANGLKTPEELREPWAVQQAKEVIQQVAWTHPEAASRIDAFQITSDEHQAFAAQLLHEVKAEWNAVEAKRKKITKPLDEAKRETQAVFKPVLAALETVEKTLKEKIAGYMAAKQQANTLALQAAAAAPSALAATQAIESYAPVQAPQGISVREVWKFEVTDPDAVPRHLCSPDMKKIGEELGAKADKFGQPDSIPGVRVYKESVVTARSG